MPQDTYHCLFCHKEGTKKDLGLTALVFKDVAYDDNENTFWCCSHCAELLRDMVMNLRGKWADD